MFTSARRAAAKRVSVLLVTMLMLFSSLSFSAPVHADTSMETTGWACGSYTLCKNGGYRPYLEYFCSGDSTTAGVARKTYINVYMKAGERLALGSSVFDSELDINDGSGGKNCDIVIVKPDGTKESRDVKKKGDGLISNVAQETAGPNVDGSNPAGFKPLFFTASADGVYQVRFHSQTGVKNDTNPTKTVVTGTWSQSKSTVAAWNVTVLNTDNAVQSGRIFTKCLALNMGASKDQGKDVILKSNVYVVTSDGYIYDTDFNGMNPWGFIFFANNRGLVSTKTNFSLYKSFVSNDNQLSDLPAQGATYQNPWSADTDMDKTFDIFFEYPDPELEGVLYPTSYEPETAKNLTFIGSNGDNSTHIGFGGYFKFDVTNATSATVTIDLSHVLMEDGSTVDFGTVKLSNAVTHGTNYFRWDGYGANGELVPVGSYDSSSIRVSVETFSGEYHFPMFDVEGALNGIRITRINPIYREAVDVFGNIYKQDVSSLYDDKKSVIFYDNLSRASDPNYQNGTNRIADGLNCIDGVDSSGGAMIFDLAPNGTYYGDFTSLDIWTHSNNGEPLSITLGTPIVITDDPYTVLSGRVFYDERYTPGGTENYFALQEKDYTLSEVEVELNYTYTGHDGVPYSKTVTTVTDSYGHYYFAGIPISDSGDLTTCRVTVKRPMNSYVLTTENTTTNASLTKGTEEQTVVLGGLDTNDELIYTPGVELSDVGYNYRRLSTGIEIRKDWVTDISSDNTRPTDVSLTVQSYYIDSSYNRIDVKDYEFVLNNANRWAVYANELPAYEDAAQTRPLYYEITSERYSMRGSGESFTFESGDSSDGYPYQTSFSIDTSKREITLLTATNAPKNGTIQIVKRDAHNHLLTLQGVAFELLVKTDLTKIPEGEQSEYRASDGVIYHKIQSGETNENGILTFNNLSRTDYFVVESAAKVGYALDSTIYPFALSAENPFLSQTVYNTPQVSSLTVIKEVDAVLPGETVPITVSYADNDAFYNPVTQDYTVTLEDGSGTYTVCTVTVPSGSYVKISENPSCYALDSESSSVYNDTAGTFFKTSYSNGEVFRTENGDQYTVTLYNSCTGLSYNMQVNKQDERDALPLPGATFTLYSDKTCTAVLASGTTALDESGAAIATFSKLDAGTYYLKETTAPPGYRLSDDVKTIVIASDGSVTVDGQTVAVTSRTFSFTVTNAVQTYTMKLKKIDGNSNAPLEGATFALYKDEACENMLASGTTALDENSEATATYPLLEAGTYYLKETVAPSGYVLPGDVREIVILTDGSVTVDGYAVTVSDDTFSITVANSLQIVIPQSGTSFSAMLVMLIGVAICMAGLTLALVYRKKATAVLQNKSV